MRVLAGRYCLITLSLLFTFCKAIAESAPENLDLNTLLPEQTPLQFSTRSLKDCLQSVGVGMTHTRDFEGQTLQPVSKTSIFNQSFVTFIKESYNQKNYADVLSQDGYHIIQFFELCNELNLDIETTYVILRLYKIKLDSAEIIDASVCNQIIHSLPLLPERFFEHGEIIPEAKTNLTFLKQHIEDSMLSKLTSHYHQFQEQPGEFVTSIADDIAHSLDSQVEKIKQNVQKHMIQERFRQMILRFLNAVLGKAIWSQHSPEGIWSSFIEISHGLQLLATHGIINHMDDLDELLWLVTHRMCFFLDLSGWTLPLEFYEEVEDDLENKLVYFLETKEQDDDIRSKKDMLSDALLQAKVKAIAFHKKGVMAHHFVETNIPKNSLFPDAAPVMGDSIRPARLYP
ncbi:MAG: hypothetical protein H6679_03140 [Epsilonproteobacteria bacterium]|nr:hypothetical protein [Campylobacterota bacterium]